MGFDVGEASRGQSRSPGSSKASSKKMQVEATEKEEKEEKEEGLTREDYINMLGESIFETFMQKREAALKRAADMRKMRLMTRHSARYIDSHKRSLTNEFQKFLEYADQQRAAEQRKARLLGLPPRSAPANVFGVRATGTFGLGTPPEKLTPEERKERRTNSKQYLKLQMQRIQGIRASRTASGSFKAGTPPLQAIDPSSARRKLSLSVRPSTQFSAEFLQVEPPHYAVNRDQRMPVTAVSAETEDADLYRWMEDFFKIHVPAVPSESMESIGSRGGQRGSRQLRDEQV